jgi:RNA polymerase sigma factor (sigma-70 family)
MNAGTLGAIVRRILLDAEQKTADQSDLCLLKCFVTEKDEAAFAALMKRHGRLVFAVCRSVLDQEQDAEDAFQATFLVLARMASSIRKGDSLASWLHGVARRTALKARQAMNTRRRIERNAEIRAAEQPASEAALRELQAILHEEVGRLAEKYRAPFVLCCLEGKSRMEASEELGWKEGTVASRVARARKQLESRLRRRGVALPAALTAAALAPTAASAALPVALLSAVARGAVAFAGNVPAAVSSAAVTLAEGVIQAMFVTKLKMISGVVLVLALVLSGGGLLAYSAWQSQVNDPALAARPPRPPGDKVVAAPAPKPDPEPDMPPAARYGLETPLPPGAIVRFGSTRFRTGTVVGSMKLSLDGKRLVSGGRASGGGVFVWDAVTGERLLWRPLGEEGELSRDGKRLFLIESLPAPKAKAKPPANPMLADVVTTMEVKVSPLMTEVKNALRIYQISTGKLLRQIDGSGRLYRVAISPDERTLALEYNIPNANTDPANFSANWFFKTRVELYDLKAGRVTHKLGELPQNYAGNGLVRFSADGKTLFAVSSSKENENRNESTVRRFDVATGALKSKTTIEGMGYQMPRGYHTRLNAADKTLILSGTTLWDLDKERRHWALKGNDLQAIFAFMPDGRTAIAWTVKEKWLDKTNPSTSCKLVHWDLEADREIRRLPGISFAAVSPDGKTAFGASWTGVSGRWLRWDLAGGREIDAVDAPTSPPDQLTISPDGKYVATTGRVWERATGKCVHRWLHDNRNVLFFTPDSKALVGGTVPLPRQRPNGGGQAFGLRMLDTATWKESIREFEGLEANMNLYYCGLSLSPDGKVMAGPYQLWDFASGKVLCKLKHDDVQSRLSLFAFSPDRKKLAYFAPGNRVEVLNIAEKKVVGAWPIGDHRDRNLYFVKGGQLVASSYLPPRPPWRGMLRWPEEQHKPIPADLPATMPPMPDVVVRVWDPATGKEKYRFQYPQSEYDGTEMPPLFSPDGKLLATAGLHDDVIHFRDPASGKEVGQFRCGAKGVHSMAFSPDSQVLAVSAKDTTVLLVDVRKVIGKR